MIDWQDVAKERAKTIVEERARATAAEEELRQLKTTAYFDLFAKRILAAENLAAFAWHQPGCTATYENGARNPGNPCDCGFDAARLAAEDSAESPEQTS